MFLAVPASTSASGDTIADRVLGQVDFLHGTSPSFVHAKSLDNDHGYRSANPIAIDTAHNPSALYVGDLNSNRVLAWRDVSSFVNGEDADLVIGAPDFFTGSRGCLRDATGLCLPLSLAVDPSGDLFVSGDHVEKCTAPFTQSLPVSGTTFISEGQEPLGVASDSQGNIYIAMYEQNQVLEYDAGSTTPHRIFGSFSSPYAVAVDRLDNLYVVDRNNDCVLVFHTSLDAASGLVGAGDSTADVVIGQSAGAEGTSSTSLRSPQGVAVDPHGNLYVADLGNNRVTEYDAPLHNGEAATLIIGQPNPTSNWCNQPTIGAGTLCGPSGVATDSSGNLYVFDSKNNRVLAYAESNPPRTKTASRVLGQHDLTHGTRNFVDATTVNARAVAIDRSSIPNHLYAVDAVNNRVLGYHDAATFRIGRAADLVLGQPDFFSAFRNGSPLCCDLMPNARGLALGVDALGGIAVDSRGNVWVSDPGNLRVVGYPAPFSSGLRANEAATKVLGQPGPLQQSRAS